MKKLSIILAALIATSLLAGCGSDKEETPEDTTSTTAVEDTTSTTAVAETPKEQEPAAEQLLTWDYISPIIDNYQEEFVYSLVDTYEQDESLCFECVGTYKDEFSLSIKNVYSMSKEYQNTVYILTALDGYYFEDASGFTDFSELASYDRKQLVSTPMELFGLDDMDKILQSMKDKVEGNKPAKVLTAEYIEQMLDDPATYNYAFSLSELTELSNEFTFTYTYNDEFTYSSTYLYDADGKYLGTHFEVAALGECTLDPNISKILDVEFAMFGSGKLRSGIIQMEGFEDMRYSYARFNLIANPSLPDTSAVEDALDKMIEAETTYHFTTGLEGPSYKCTMYSDVPIYIYIDNIDTLVNYRGPEDIASFDTKDNCLKVTPKKRGKGTIVITYKDGSSCSIALEIYI